MENAVLVGIALAIFYNMYKLRQKQKEVRQSFEDLKRANEDLNIEFGSSKGTGISLKRKHYPTLEDDHRQTVGEVKKK